MKSKQGLLQRDRVQDGCNGMTDAPDRKQRLAAALRENLHRRKQQQRARRKNGTFLDEKGGDIAFSPDKPILNDPIHGADPSVRDQDRTD